VGKWEKGMEKGKEGDEIAVGTGKDGMRGEGGVKGSVSPLLQLTFTNEEIKWHMWIAKKRLCRKNSGEVETLRLAVRSASLHCE
jgi:hypothetical protein